MELEAGDVARLRAGDVRALEACYRVFGARVLRLCRNLLGRERGEDAAQEVFVKVFERARSFSGRSSFSTWIYRVTVNHCLHVRERELRRVSEPLSESSGVDADPFRGVDERESVERLLASLGPEHRDVLVLREVSGLDYREIAEVLGIPEGTVMSRLHRARRKLIEDAAARAATREGAAVRVRGR
jgi:RNA polymerase sigma-70 factor (ECF subfamily)